MVLPDGGDGVRRLFSGADGEDDGGQSAGNQLVHGERRQVIQQMGVVDTDDDLAIPSVADESVNDLTDSAEGIWAESLAMSAKAPSGTLRADAVPTIQRRRAFRGPQPETVSRATRVLPTPAEPDSTIPRRAPRPPGWPRRSPRALRIARPVATGGSPADSNRHRRPASGFTKARDWRVRRQLAMSEAARTRRLPLSPRPGA